MASPSLCHGRLPKVSSVDLAATVVIGTALVSLVLVSGGSVATSSSTSLHAIHSSQPGTLQRLHMRTSSATVTSVVHRQNAWRSGQFAEQDTSYHPATQFRAPSRFQAGVISVLPLAISGTLVALGMWARTLWRRRPVDCLVMAAISGDEQPSYHTSQIPFDPLHLASNTSSPRPNTLEVLHARLVLTWALATSMGPLFITSQALAAETEKGLNSNFDVIFNGQTVDHKLLIYLVILGQFIGFIGAYVGGATSRARQLEAEELAKKLMIVNQQLRQNRRRMRTRVRTEATNAEEAVITNVLREGKAMLKEKESKAALTVFQSALRSIMEASTLGKKQLGLERKAYRGVGAALQQLGRYEEAMEAMQVVVQLTQKIGDQAGITDAYGVMADILTENGQLAQAGKYYDLYLASLDAEMVEDEEASRYRL